MPITLKWSAIEKLHNYREERHEDEIEKEHYV